MTHTDESAATWLRALEDFQPVISADHQLETRENTHSFNLVEVDSPRAVIDALLDLSSNWLNQSSVPVFFYLWHDDQMSALRFSLTSARVETRFGRRLEIISSPDPVVEAAFRDAAGEPFILSPLDLWGVEREQEVPLEGLSPLPVWVRGIY